MPFYTAQRHVVSNRIRFAKEAMQHVCTGAVQRAAQYVIVVMQREACSSVLCIKASALSIIISCLSVHHFSSCPVLNVRSGTSNLMTVNTWSLS